MKRYKIFIGIVFLFFTFITVMSSCKKAIAPAISTVPVSDITQTTANSGGIVTSEGSSSLVSRGVCWNTSSNPTTKNYKAISGTILEMFPSNLTNLTPSTTYYLRAFASNTSETGYGNEVSFTTKSLEKAIIQTNEIVSMTANSIVYSGKILSSGGSPLIERGACWSSNQNPTVDDNKKISPVGLDTFTGKVTNLMANQTYYLRVYAINSIGISYGNQISFSTCNLDQVIDKDGNVYNTVQIGTQIWMMENLKSTIFNDGDSISFITDVYSWAYTSAPAYSWYNNDKEFKNPYGALYNWYVVFTGKLCPLGWHVPTYENFKILVDYLGGKDIAGGKLKDIDSGDWTYPNAGATNESGFTGLPSGIYGGFVDVSDNMGICGYWWSSTAATTINSYSLTLRYDSASTNGPDDKAFNKIGLSVRCIKDSI